jgi:hypothetical protein
MTKAEMAAHFRKERERDKQALLSEIKSTVQPIHAERQVAEGKRLVTDWRASRKDLSDEVVSIAYAKCREFEKLLPPGAPLDLSTTGKIDAFLSPFVAQAQTMLRTAKSSQGSKPTTESPTRPSRPGPKNLKKMSLADMAEEAARRIGHASLNEAVGKFSS